MLFNNFKNKIHKLKQSKLYKGSGSIYLGAVILLVCLTITLMLMEQYNMFEASVKNQLITDLIADGSAISGITPAHYDDNLVYDMADKLAKENTVNGENINYSVDIENEYAVNGVPTGNKLIKVESTVYPKHYIPDYFSYNERFEVKSNAVVRVEAPSTVNGYLNVSFMTNWNNTLPFVASSPGHRNPAYVTWFVTYYLSPEYNSLYDSSFGTVMNQQYITDYMVCMGFDKFASFQHGHGGWDNYLGSSEATSDGWFSISSLTQAQNYANQGMAVVLVEQGERQLSVVVPSQGNMQSNEIALSYVTNNSNKNFIRVLHSDITDNAYKVYVFNDNYA